MGTVKQFEDLGVWQDARALSRLVYAITKQREFYRDVDLRRQMRSAAVSSMSNIAEGFERGTRQEFVHFLNIAKGSNGEVRSQLYVALDQDYLSAAKFDELKSAALALSRRIAKFVRYLESCPANTRVRKPAKRSNSKT